LRIPARTLTKAGGSTFVYLMQDVYLTNTE